jgi:hypothetical protein
MLFSPSFRTPVAFARLAVVLLTALALLASASAALAQRSTGVVSSYADGTVWLDDGTSFTVTEGTRIIVTNPGTVEDLQPGQYVAITAARLDDGSLLASIVRVFPESQRGSRGGQFEEASGNLMTNASIDEATIDLLAGSVLMVSFQGQMEHVVIPPTVQISVLTDGTLADIQPGARITATVTDGVASSVSLGA